MYHYILEVNDEFTSTLSWAEQFYSLGNNKLFCSFYQPESFEGIQGIDSIKEL